MSGTDRGRNVGASYDPETDTFHALYQPGQSGQLTGAVIYLVSVATGKDPETMDPLYDAVDVDALERLFQPQEGEPVEVEFRFNGCEVIARSNGEVVVSPLEINE